MKKGLGKIIGGKLDLKNKNLTSLKDIGEQPNLKILILSNNKISSFQSLQPQPNLTTIIADHNPNLKSLYGLNVQPSLENLDIQYTPLEKEQTHVILASVENKLKKLNNHKVTEKDHRLAEIYLRTKQPLLLQKDEELQIEKSSDEIEQENILHDIYVYEHQETFLSFAENEAILFDLENNDEPFPECNNESTNEEYYRAILNLQKRNKKLQDEIQRRQEELNKKTINDDINDDDL